MEEKCFLTIPNDEFRTKCFYKNRDKFEFFIHQLMAYNSLFQNEMIFPQKEMDDNLEFTLKIIDDLRNYILEQQKEIKDELLVVDDYESYDKYIQDKYRQLYPN